MAEPFIGELRAFPFGFAPRGWALCEGQEMAISQNQALYAILGTTYGGNGTTTFRLPDLRGRVPVHVGNGVTLGQAAGEETHALTVQEMPAHTHTVEASNQDGRTRDAQGNVWAKTNQPAYGTPADSTMSPMSVSQAGGNQAHANMQPYQVVNYCIAVVGIFPSRN